MATPNYSYEKRQRELAKKRKVEEKRQRKVGKVDGDAPAADGQDGESTDGGPAADPASTDDSPPAAA